MSNADRSESLVSRLTDRDTLYRLGLYLVMYGLAAVFFIPYVRMFELSVTPLSVMSDGGSSGFHRRRHSRSGSGSCSESRSSTAGRGIHC
ncbi:hypothetical protein ACFQL1_17055 [Halomicroarcula sp. GCM10025709]|uniref:hypothetical protein n=1 Tax=Halomicroarcula sp. GCM10025709 TaxID=3252669 RepID=UPI00360658DC